MKFSLSAHLALAFFGVLSIETLASDISDKTEQVIVTSTGEERLKREVAASVHAITEEDIAMVSPSHPAELLNRVPGVHINNLGGEGHMSAIRQPISTSAVYLFLEDGIPTRPTGFFNHNGLYEINIPQSKRVEVIKGPGSALYGSGAIGGVINVVTKSSLNQKEGQLSVESGGHQWRRALISGGMDFNADTGIRTDINVTDNQGHREASAYDRTSSSVRIDSALSSHWKMTSVVAYSEVNQSGSSSLEEDDYVNNPEKNRFHGDVAYREVEALRFSSEFVREEINRLTTITPYVRNNAMNMMPSWMVTFDPNIRMYDFHSYGALLRQRLTFDKQFSLVAGLDLDYTPSQYLEERITFGVDDVVSRLENGRTVIDTYLDYTRTNQFNYDFDTEQFSVSPYIHSEWRFAPRWLMSAGLRYDYFNVDYTNNLSTVNVLNRAAGLNHIRPASQELDYDQFSPKWSLLYDVGAAHTIYANYRHSFVSPSVGALFRPGSSFDSVNLKPVTADSVELGVRGLLKNNIEYEIALYSMAKKNDIVSIIDGVDRRVVNAGETHHQGIELGISGYLSASLRVAVAYTYTQQEYDQFQYVFQCFSPVCGRSPQAPPVIETRDFAGFDIAKAPRSLANISFHYSPPFVDGLGIELEMSHVGDYFTDETNTQSYDGHDLFNLRLHYDITTSVALHLRTMNVSDERYSTYTSNQVNNPEIGYRPGLPRTVFLGLQARF